jgi:hypothetical protein
MKVRIQIYIICCVTAALSLESAAVPASEFITLGPGFAIDLTADGSVVFTSEGRWTRDGGLVPPPIPGSWISDDGSVGVGNLSADGPAYRWTAETGIEELSAPPDFPFASPVAFCVSGDGNVIGGYIRDPGNRAWIWTEEDGYRWLGGAQFVSGLSADGRVASGTDSNSSGFRWTHETGLVRLPTLGGGPFPTIATELSADGSVVVGHSPSARMPEGRVEAFRWTEEGGIKGLGAFPGARSSSAYGVSADGFVVTGISRSGSLSNLIERAFVWDEFHGIRDLEEVLREDYGLVQLPPGVRGSSVYLSADRRTIVGNTSNGGWAVYLDYSIGPPLPEFGDYNADGKVGQPDLNLALGKWGQDLGDFAYPWINDLPVAAVGQGELDAVVLNWPLNAGPLDLSLGLSSGALTANYDLKTNAAIIDYTGPSPVGTVRQQILAGRGGPGLGKPWNGNGITSSTAAGANAVEPESRAIGYAENAALPLGTYTTFRGQAFDDTALLIAFSRTGDANLDGVVNDDDVTIVGATYSPGVSQPHWALGDFDYNGFVDDDDVTLLGVFYDPSASPLAASAPPSAADVAAVAEPSTLILAAFLTALAAACGGRSIRLRQRR